MDQTSKAIDEVVQSVLAKAGVLGARELAAWKRPQDDIRKLCQRDYPASVRRHLSPGQIKELLYRARKVWPHFNQKVLGPPSGVFFSRAADALQLHFKAAHYSSLALYGFYIDRANTQLSKPLIFINSAHHALAIGTAFCHEVGHHFCTEVRKPRKPAGISFYFDAAYHSHLRDKRELFADAVVSLAGYPQATAAKLFTQALAEKTSSKGALDQALIARIRKHIERSYGFEFSASLSPRQNLQYLAGMLHYAKLRAALLQEFDV